MENKLIKNLYYKVDNKQYTNAKFIFKILKIDSDYVEVKYIKHSYGWDGRMVTWGRNCNYERWCISLGNNRIEKVLYEK